MRYNVTIRDAHREELIDTVNIELSDKEFRRLLDLVYIGNWILNSTRGEDRFEDYDLLQERIKSSTFVKTVNEQVQGDMSSTD